MTIPLGATSNMGGAAITITVMTMACSLFGIPDEVSMQVVAVGFGGVSAVAAEGERDQFLAVQPAG